MQALTTDYLLPLILVCRAYDAGTFFSKRYWDKFKNREGIWVRSSGQERVVESGRFFMQVSLANASSHLVFPL